MILEIRSVLSASCYQIQIQSHGADSRSFASFPDAVTFRRNDLGVSVQLMASKESSTVGANQICLVSGQISDMVARRMSNKGRARILVMAVGPILIIVASLMLILLDLTNFGLFYATAFIFSFGGSWGLGTFYSILPEIFDEERLSIITGLAGGAGDMGMPLAPLLVGVVFGARGMWHLGWSVCIVISLLSILACFLLLGNKKVRGK